MCRKIKNFLCQKGAHLCPVMYMTSASVFSISGEGGLINKCRRKPRVGRKSRLVVLNMCSTEIIQVYGQIFTSMKKHGKLHIFFNFVIFLAFRCASVTKCPMWEGVLK